MLIKSKPIHIVHILEISLMRKISSLLLAAGIIAAPATSEASLYFSGMYGTLGIGALWEKGKHKFVDPVRGKNQAMINSFGPAGSFHLGYVTEIKVSTVMVGGELYYFYPSFGKRINLIPEGSISQGNARIVRNGSYGAALVAGKLINPKIMVYAKLAYDIAPTQFKYYDLTFGSVRNKIYKKSFRTFTPGLGFRYAMSDRFHIGAEYNIAGLGKYVIRKDSQVIDGASRLKEVKLMEQRFLVTFTYQITSAVSSEGAPKDDE